MKQNFEEILSTRLTKDEQNKKLIINDEGKF